MRNHQCRRLSWSPRFAFSQTFANNMVKNTIFYTFTEIQCILILGCSAFTLNAPAKPAGVARHAKQAAHSIETKWKPILY
jgi:hypothetical protein